MLFTERYDTGDEERLTNHLGTQIVFIPLPRESRGVYCEHISRSGHRRPAGIQKVKLDSYRISSYIYR